MCADHVPSLLATVVMEKQEAKSLSDVSFVVYFSTADYASTRIIGIPAPIDFPFNREGYRYYLVEKDLTVPNR